MAITIEDHFGNQPLRIVVFEDNGCNARIEIIRLLLSHGADPDHKNKVDKSPRDIPQIAGFTNLDGVL